MGIYITVGVIVLVVGYLIYGFYKVKNLKDTPPSERIKVANDKNFKQVTSNGLVAVDFWAPWCGPCKMIAPVLNEIADEYPGKITIAKVNVDQNQALAQKFKIRGIPTMIVFKNGKEMKRIVGVKPKNTLVKELQLT
jgi:thioredoxin 1